MRSPYLTLIGESRSGTWQLSQVRLSHDTQILEESNASGKMVVGAKWATMDPDTAYAIAADAGRLSTGLDK